jgi:hypothetical protein
MAITLANEYNIRFEKVNLTLVNFKGYVHLPNLSREPFCDGEMTLNEFHAPYYVRLRGYWRIFHM